MKSPKSQRQLAGQVHQACTLMALGTSPKVALIVSGATLKHRLCFSDFPCQLQAPRTRLALNGQTVKLRLNVQL